MVSVCGTVTIGQSPRVDLLPEIVDMVEGDIKFVEKGALDDLSVDQIAELVPEKDSDTLVTRLRDGTQVRVGKNYIESYVQEKIEQLNGESVDFITLLCSGSFEALDSDVPLIFPNNLLMGTLSALDLPHKIGFLVPSKDQIPHGRNEFEELGFSAVGLGASPYGKVENIVETAGKFRNENVDLIVMHCFGYSYQMKRTVIEATEKPVVLVRSILARFLSELLI